MRGIWEQQKLVAAPAAPPAAEDVVEPIAEHRVEPIAEHRVEPSEGVGGMDLGKEEEEQTVLQTAEEEVVSSHHHHHSSHHHHHSSSHHGCLLRVGRVVRRDGLGRWRFWRGSGGPTWESVGEGQMSRQGLRPMRPFWPGSPRKRRLG